MVSVAECIAAAVVSANEQEHKRVLREARALHQRMAVTAKDLMAAVEEGDLARIARFAAGYDDVLATRAEVLRENLHLLAPFKGDKND
jgi:cell division septum initiation protein DivIVA